MIKSELIEKLAEAHPHLYQKDLPCSNNSLALA